MQSRNEDDINAWIKGYDAAKEFCKNQRKKLITKAHRKPSVEPNYLEYDAKFREDWLKGWQECIDSRITKQQEKIQKQQEKIQRLEQQQREQQLSSAQETRKRKRNNDESKQIKKRPRGEHNKQDFTKEEADVFFKNLSLELSQFPDKLKLFYTIFEGAKRNASGPDVAKEAYPHLTNKASLKRQLERTMEKWDLQYSTLKKPTAMNAANKYFYSQSGQQINLSNTTTSTTIIPTTIIPTTTIPTTTIPTTTIPTTTIPTTIPTIPLRIMTRSIIPIPTTIPIIITAPNFQMLGNHPLTFFSQMANMNSAERNNTDDTSELELAPQNNDSSGHIKKRRLIPGWY